MQPQQLGAARGYQFDAAAQFRKCRSDMPHQRLALRTQTEVAAVALEQHDPERLLHLADSVAHGAGRQMQFRSRRLKGVSATCGLEYAQLRDGYFREHEQ